MKKYVTEFICFITFHFPNIGPLTLTQFHAYSSAALQSPDFRIRCSSSSLSGCRIQITFGAGIWMDIPFEAVYEYSKWQNWKPPCCGQLGFMKQTRTAAYVSAGAPTDINVTKREPPAADSCLISLRLKRNVCRCVVLFALANILLALMPIGNVTDGINCLQ